MKKTTFLLIIAFLFITFPHNASGKHFSDGNQLLQACNQAIKYFDSDERSNVFNAGSCWGYIRAANDMYEIMAQDSIRTICIPSETGTQQMIRVVVKYLIDHPERLHNVASLLIYEAFKESFPCPTK